MKIGDEIRFIPETDVPRGVRAPTVKGTIVGIHRGHRFYRVRYTMGSGTFHECFKFIPEGNKDIQPLAMSRWG